MSDADEHGEEAERVGAWHRSGGLARSLGSEEPA